MACEGPSLIKLSLLFLDVSEGLRVVFFLCLLAFVCPPPRKLCEPAVLLYLFTFVNMV